MFVLFLSTLFAPWAGAAVERGMPDAEKLFLGGEYAESRKVLSNLVQEGRGDARVFYLQGLCDLKMGSYIPARDAFEKARHGEGLLGEQAVLSIGDAYFLEGNAEKALQTYEDFLKRRPRSDLKAAALFRQAQAVRRLGQWSKARRLYEALSSEYPQAWEAGRAREILDAGEFYFTVQVGSFGARENAEKLYVELVDKDFPAFLSTASQGGRTFHRVRVGRFQDRAEADQVRARLELEGLPTKLIP